MGGKKTRPQQVLRTKKKTKKNELHFLQKKITTHLVVAMPSILEYSSFVTHILTNEGERNQIK